MMARMSNQDNKRQRQIRELTRRIPKPETKFVTKNIAHNATVTSSTFVNSVANGPDNGERIGRKTKTLFVEGFTTSTSVSYRCVLYVSKSGSETLSLTNRYDPVDPEKFIILKDWYITNQEDGRSSFFKHKLPYGLNSEYDGVLNSEIVQGQITLYMHGTASGTINGYTRAWYVDN